MAIDWNYLFDLKVDELNDERVDLLLNQLIEFNPDNEDNVQRLRKLFEISKSLMQIKSVQAEVAVEELEETVKKYNKEEFNALKKELQIYKQSDIKGENIGLKFSEANDQILELKNTIQSKDSELIKMKRKLSDLQNSLDLRDKEVISLRSEVESLRDEMDNQRQVDDQVIERQEPIEKLREKNKQIQRLLDELRDIETVNLELTNQIKKLKLELKSATNELQISCNQMEMLSKQMNELKQLNEDFVTEKQFLTDEIRRLSDGLNRYESGDETIIDKYSENIEQLRHLVQLKDEEIIKLKSLELMPNQNFKEKSERMVKEMSEKDRQIDLLKSQLNEAVNDMESQTEIIRKLYQQNRGTEDVSKLNETIVSLNNQLKTIEEEVLAKDEELLNIRKRINTYERGEYGLKDALKEVNDLTKHLNNRDQRMEEMIQQINELKLNLNDAEDAIDGLQDGQPNSSVIRSTRNGSRKVEKKWKIKLLEMEHQLLRLEDEKIGLTERLRLSLNKSVVDKHQENKEIHSLRKKLQFFETENFELQLGMKEILNGIRESDSQSDVVIECPSLERVCQLLESRTIGGDLTNIIALKAELDLVRGHNEQLRTDMRRLRNDYLKVISQYTEDLLETDVIPIDSDISDKELDYIDRNDVKVKEWQTSSDTKGKVSEKEVIIRDYNDIKTEKERKERTESNELEEQIPRTSERGKDFMTRETQTLPISDSYPKDQTNRFTQTENNFEIKGEQTLQSNISDNSNKNLCENCKRVMKIVDFLKNCVQKLEENIKRSETKYTQRLQLLQNENKNLTESFNKKLNETNAKLAEKEAEISSLQNQLTSNQLVATSEDESTVKGDDDLRLVKKYPKRSQQLSLSCKTVLESVINCLQARLEHKEESIRQYRNMMSETKQNFENEMIRLIDSNKENEDKNSINFSQLIDNEELESALKNCLNELEICKTELNSRISELETELEAKNAKLIAYQNENEKLRLKRNSPNNQFKQIMDEMKEEIKQKDLTINALNKSIKDDRAMRATAPIRQPKDDSPKSEKKVENQMFQEIADLRAVIETQKKTIKNLEVLKWDLEKNLKTIKEQSKEKFKEKETEILELKEKANKMKVRLNKNENERQLLQNKVIKRENALKNTSNKWTQISSTLSEHNLQELKTQLKKLKNEVKEREIEAKILKKDLELCRQTESELKTLLKESVKREKLATIQEESTQSEEQYERLLQENAQIKVELRMAEFELKRRSDSEP